MPCHILTGAMHPNKLALNIFSPVALVIPLFLLAPPALMLRQIAPFDCACGCGPVKSRATEQRHLELKHAPLYIQYSQTTCASSDPTSPLASTPEEEMEVDFGDDFDVQVDTPNLDYGPMDINIDEPPGLCEVSGSDSESEDSFFAGEDAEHGWELDADWDKGEEPW
ncbi:hypothetical protein DFH08DRAFT_797982 [Mycena albidolilacea]|uniref:Uncharacterized protein n=1 Tax=Mycena albidolilacea TaxID=1033008 RepID=A0AAD7ATD9_9AGAR|nr:hypothetical protein DFH08DRAFT_797982 [Mycena albidolilacea]